MLSWKYNIIVDLQEVGLESVDRIYVTEDGDSWWASMNRVMNIHVV